MKEMKDDFVKSEYVNLWKGYQGEATSEIDWQSGWV